MQTRRLVSPTHRLIASRFPTIGLFDDIAESEEDLRVAFQLEEMTNGRLQAMRRLQNLPDGGVVTGPTASLVMAAFLHCHESGGRFTEARLGAWYAATEIETAIEETVYHHERRLRLSDGGFPNRIQMRELVAPFDADLLDLCGLRDQHPELYDRDNYAQSQAFAAARRWPFASPGFDGLIYDSVRRDGGTNVCIFRPAAVPRPVVQGAHYEYVWGAKGALTILTLTQVERVA